MKNKLWFIGIALTLLLPIIACYSPYDDGIYKKVDSIYTSLGTSTNSANLTRVISNPYTYAIAEGDINGHSSIIKSGYCPSVSTTQIDLWGLASVYVPPASAIQMSVKSSSTDDDGVPAGIGARVIEIHYLNSSYAEKTVTVTMDGTTWVDTSVTDIFRVQGFHVTSTGSSGYPVGNVSLVDKATKAITYGYILAGYNRAFSSVYTIPVGKTMYITSWSAGSSSGAAKSGDFILKATMMEGVKTSTWFGIDRILVQDGMGSINFTVPIRIPTTTDIKVSVKGSGAITATVHYEGWLEDN